MAAVVEGDSKAPFSIATTPMCMGECYSFPTIAQLYLDTYLIILSIKQGGIKYHFLSFRYDSIWDWTAVPRGISEHSTTTPMGRYAQNNDIRTNLIIAKNW